MDQAGGGHPGLGHPLKTLYCLWATVSIALALLAGGPSPENATRLMVLAFLALQVAARDRLTKALPHLPPRARFVLMGTALATVVEGFHMISRPVFPALRIAWDTPPAAALTAYAIDLLFTVPAYLVIFSVIWRLVNRYRYPLWTYVILMALGQALGDGGLFFFAAAPGLLWFLPYPMTNYHAVNVIPYLAVRDGLTPTHTRGAWIAVPAVIATYLACGAAIRLVGGCFGYSPD